MSHKLTTAEFKKRLEEVRLGEIELLSEYRGSTKPIKIKFLKCGHTVLIHRPYNLLNGSKCRICNNANRRLTTDEFKQRVYDLVGNEYTVASKYVNMRTKINIIHNKCGYKDWWVRPDSFLNGDRCPKCSNKAAKSTDQFKQEVKEKFGNEYTVLGNYVNRSTPIRVKHNKCGYEWSPTPSNLLNNKSHCKRCRNKRLPRR